MGSFKCSCGPGFKLSTNGRSCVGRVLLLSMNCDSILLYVCTDDDECSINNGGCEYMCVNTPSSFMCICPTGFVLDSDGTSCNGKRKFNNFV